MILSTVPGLAGTDTITETYWTTYVRNNLNNLMGRPMAMARFAPNQAQAVSSGSWTSVSWGEEVFDTDSMFAVGFPTYMYVTTPGQYLLLGSGGFSWDATATGVRAARLLKNAATTPVNLAVHQWNVIAGSDWVTAQVHGVADLAAGDTITLQVYQNSGSSLVFGWPESTDTETPAYLAAVFLGT